MTNKDVRPFLPFTSTPTRALGAALPAITTPEVTSPWTPRAVEAGPVGPTADQLARVIDDAHAQGVADGLAETAGLRAQLTALVDQLTRAHAAIVAPAADTIADVASCVIEAWLGHAEPSQLFRPVIARWLAHAGGGPAPLPSAAAPGSVAITRAPDPPPVTARVAPGDVAALAEAIGGAAIAIVADPALAPGAIELRGPALELSHSWAARLPDLRAAIITALTGAADASDEPGAGR